MSLLAKFSLHTQIIEFYSSLLYCSQIYHSSCWLPVLLHTSLFNMLPENTLPFRNAISTPLEKTPYARIEGVPQ